MNDNNVRCKPEYRSLLAAVLMSEPSARDAFRMLRNLGATNMRPEYKFGERKACPCGCANTVCEQVPDPTVWYANCKGGLFVAMVRHGDNDWTLHS